MEIKTDKNVISKEYKPSFNYRLTQLFINNNRLTILFLILVILLGTVASISMKTTGFPSPEIKLAIIATTYPGASSQTIEKDVTEPLEGAIKSIDGIKSYSSTSNNNYSQILANIEDNVNSDTVRNKIDSAVKSVSLPTGVDTPKVIAPSINGGDFSISITGNDLSKVYTVYSKVKKDLGQIPQTASITPSIELKQKVVVSIDQNKLRQTGISIEVVKAQLQSIGESIPAVSEVTLDNQSKSILTTVSAKNIEEIKNIEFIMPSGKYVLSNFADVSVKYIFDKNTISEFGYNTKDNTVNVIPAVTFTIKSSKGSDLALYTKTIEDKFSSYSDAIFTKNNNFSSTDIDKVHIVETFNQNDGNQEQVQEVVSGLVGGPLNIDGPLKNIGWILGGIQLVFLVMIAFVSIRAALVGAAAIPLSLLFSNIYLYFTGNNLNTLVLFSLVLVIGLVVDPTLVILESIQRKIDSGLRGKEAALAAVRDVGNGLFMASLTNIIVFLPFGLVSGVLGQIFSYIPLTIIPAVIGSYVVPLVFLAWIGGLFLRPNKKKTGSEEENMWPLARWIKNTNYKILNGSRILRLIIIFIAILVPLTIATIYTSTGAIKQVQFASNDDGKLLTLTADIKSSASKADIDNATKNIFAVVTANKNVATIYSDGGPLNYFIGLKDSSERSQKAQAIANDLNSALQGKYDNVFFDIKADVIQTGPPVSSYQVSLSVKSDNLMLLEKSSKDIGKTLLSVCKKDTNISLDNTCAGGSKIVTKIDDGYTNRENTVIEVLLDRNKLIEKQLTIPNAPLSILVNAQIKSLFQIDDGKKLSTIQINGDDTEIVLDKSNDSPKTLDEIKNLIIYSKSGDTIKLSDIASINQVTPRATITRVKGQTIGTILARLSAGNDDQTIATKVTTLVSKYYSDNNYEKTIALGLEKDSIGQYSEGDAASFIKSFTELLTALLLAVILTYVVLAVFFKSFTQPLVILFTIPLTFIGIFPSLAAFTGGQFGFLEIIGMIILIGIVENVAIFLIDAARQKIDHDGWDEKRAISFASGIRLRPVILTKFTAIASLAPLAVFSVFYRSISIVIMFGLLTSGFTSLFTTPILFIFFKWLSREYLSMKSWNKVLFFPLFILYILGLSLQDQIRNYTQEKPILENKNIINKILSVIGFIIYKVFLFIPFILYKVGHILHLCN